MIRVTAPYSGFNGYQSFEAGDSPAVSPEQARKMVAAGGEVVNVQGEPVGLAESVRIVRLTLGDLPAPELRDERQQELASLIES